MRISAAAGYAVIMQATADSRTKIFRTGTRLLVSQTCAAISAPILAQSRRAKLSRRGFGSPRKGLRDVGDQVVRVFDPDRNADQRRRDADLAARLFAQPG